MAIATQPHSTTSPSGVTADMPRVLDHLRAYVTIMTPERAREILSTLNWERQRDISPAWVKDLTQAMLQGELTFLSLVFAEMPNGSKRLVDGQHRLTVVGNRTDTATFPTTIIVHRVKDDTDLGELYLKYDRSRSRGPEVGLKAMGIFEQSDIKESFVKRMGPAVYILKSGFSRSFKFDKSLITRSLAVGDWLPEIEAYADALNGASCEVQNKLVRAPVAAVALATFRHQPWMAQEFWSRVASQEMLGADDPRLRLLAWLRTYSSTKFGGDILYCRYVATCWNAFFAARPIKLIKIMDPSASVRIDGTPYKGESKRPGAD